jgi:hypothetical protein
MYLFDSCDSVYLFDSEPNNDVPIVNQTPRSGDAPHNSTTILVCPSTMNCSCPVNLIHCGSRYAETDPWISTFLSCNYTQNNLEMMQSICSEGYKPVLEKAEKAMSIARMLPRRFVTAAVAAGPGWVLDSGHLSNKAFNLGIAYYNQLQAMHRFVLSIWSRSAVWNKATIDIMADANVTVLVIKHLSTLVSVMTAPDMTIQ